MYRIILLVSWLCFDVFWNIVLMDFHHFLCAIGRIVLFSILSEHTPFLFPIILYRFRFQVKKYKSESGGVFYRSFPTIFISKRWQQQRHVLLFRSWASPIKLVVGLRPDLGPFERMSTKSSIWMTVYSGLASSRIPLGATCVTGRQDLAEGPWRPTTCSLLPSCSRPSTHPTLAHPPPIFDPTFACRNMD